MSPKTKKKKQGSELAKIETALENERNKAEVYMKQLKYAKADLENLRKRTQKRIDDVIDRANGRLLMQLLPIVDELGFAIEAARTSDGDILQGVEMIKGKLEKLLNSEGVTNIQSLNESFDPHLHEAVLEEETSEFPDGRIIEEVRKGYLYKDRVLRASMVKVARNPGSKKVKEEVEDE